MSIQIGCSIRALTQLACMNMLLVAWLCTNSGYCPTLLEQPCSPDRYPLGPASRSPAGKQDVELKGLDEYYLADKHQRSTGTILDPTSSASALHVETCGVHFPRRMSDAYALEHPAASAISESFTPSA